jgi:hypothetical protein
MATRKTGQSYLRFAWGWLLHSVYPCSLVLDIEQTTTRAAALAV